jgi:hypothetical protein
MDLNRNPERKNNAEASVRSGYIPADSKRRLGMVVSRRRPGDDVWLEEIKFQYPNRL